MRGGDGRRNLVAIAIVLLILVAIGLFAWRPTPILGVDAASLSRSMNGFGIARGDECEPNADRWRCAVWDSGASGTAAYDVAVDRWGCWSAERRRGPASEGGTPRKLDGCVTLLAHIGV